MVSDQRGVSASGGVGLNAGEMGWLRLGGSPIGMPPAPLIRPALPPLVALPPAAPPLADPDIPEGLLLQASADCASKRPASILCGSVAKGTQARAASSL